MPGEPIDELSFKLNADASGAIEQTQTAMDQIEEMWDELAERAAEIGEQPWAAVNQAIKDVEKSVGDATEAQDLLNRAYEVLGERGLTIQQTYVAVAEAIKQMNMAQKEMPVEITEGLLNAQVIALKRIHENLIRVEEAYREAGKAIPIEKLDALEGRLAKIFQVGVKQQRTLPEIFERMSEATDEAIGKLGKMGSQGKKTGGIFNLLNGVTSKFGLNLSQFLTPTVLAVTAAIGVWVSMIKTLMKWMQEGIAIALKRSESHVRLAMAVRQHQRAMQELSPTVAEANAASQELAERYNIASDRADELVAQAMLQTREFALTTDQTLALAEASAILAKTQGVDELSALSAVTNFMLTGYGMGLRRLGIMVDESTVQHEAYKLGLIELTGEVDDQTRALVALNIIQEEANKFQEDAIIATDTYAESIKESEERMLDAKETMGQFLLPLVDFVANMKANIVEGVSAIFGIIATMAIKITGTVAAAIGTLGQVVKEGIRRISEQDFDPGTSLLQFGEQKWGENYASQMDLVARALENILTSGAPGDVEDALTGVGQTADLLADKVFRASRKIAEAMEKLQARFDERASAIAQRLADTLEKIERTFLQKRFDAQVDLQRDLRDLEVDTNERRVDATVDFHQRKFRLEEDHKLKMMELEERFIFDIQDAVQERDARAVLMAQRRFNMEKKQLERDKNIRTKRLKEDFQKEVLEIERERKIRRAERLLEFQEQMDDLALQEERRREEARISFDNSMRDLRNSHRMKMKELADGFLAEFDLTQDSLQAIYELGRFYLGPGGLWEELYEYIAAVAANTNLSPTATEPTTISTGTGGGVTAFQRGGTHFATSPQLIKVGEIPERIDITPLSRSTGEPKAGFEGAGAGGRGAVDINLGVELGHGLIAEIMDQTMDAVANVLVNIARKQGAR